MGGVQVLEGTRVVGITQKDDRIIEVGSEFGLVHAGMETLESTRTEAKRLDYGLDVENSDSPLEAGLGFAVDFIKSGKFEIKVASERFPAIDVRSEEPPRPHVNRSAVSWICIRWEPPFNRKSFPRLPISTRTIRTCRRTNATGRVMPESWVRNWGECCA